MDLEAFLASALPELPEDARNRLQAEYGLSDYLASVLTGDPPAIRMFDVAVAEARSQLVGEKIMATAVPETVANLLCNELFALVRGPQQKSVEELLLGGEASVKYSKVNAEQLGEVAALLLEGSISNTMAKQLLKMLYNNEEEQHGKKPRQVAKARGFELITNSEELAKLCHDVIEECPEEMVRYKLGGKFARKITKFLLGKAMASSRGNAHPERLNEILLEVLEEVAPENFDDQ
jgi:aspartyl-tRNA(Asn)/glutamyl-tRNA(Gln) amidotransferase subunit B